MLLDVKHGRVGQHPARSHDAVTARGLVHAAHVCQAANVAIGNHGDVDGVLDQPQRSKIDGLVALRGRAAMHRQPACAGMFDLARQLHALYVRVSQPHFNTDRKITRAAHPRLPHHVTNQLWLLNQR